MRQAHAHELGLLRAKQGWIGRVTGSANESFNNGILVLLMLLAGVLAAEIGELYNLKLDNVVDTLLKAIYIVIGYIFGSRILPHTPRD